MEDFVNSRWLRNMVGPKDFQVSSTFDGESERHLLDYPAQSQAGLRNFLYLTFLSPWNIRMLSAGKAMTQYMRLSKTLENGPRQRQELKGLICKWREEVLGLVDEREKSAK